MKVTTLRPCVQRKWMLLLPRLGGVTECPRQEKPCELYLVRVSKDAPGSRDPLATVRASEQLTP
jgi:hypothetical protein